MSLKTVNTTAHAGEGTPGAGRAGGTARPWGLLRGAGPRLRTPGEDARKGTPLLSSPRPRSIATVQGQGGQQQPLLPPPTWCPLREGREAGRPAKPGPREPPPWAGQGGRGARAQRALREHRGPFRRPRQHPALSEHLHWCPLTLTKINPKRIFTFRKTAESENTVQCFFCSNVREGLPEPPCGRPQVLPQGRRPTLLLRGRHRNLTLVPISYSLIRLVSLHLRVKSPTHRGH